MPGLEVLVRVARPVDAQRPRPVTLREQPMTEGGRRDSLALRAVTTSPLASACPRPAPQCPTRVHPMGQRPGSGDSSAPRAEHTAPPCPHLDEVSPLKHEVFNDPMERAAKQQPHDSQERTPSSKQGPPQGTLQWQCHMPSHSPSLVALRQAISPACRIGENA